MTESKILLALPLIGYVLSSIYFVLVFNRIERIVTGSGKYLDVLDNVPKFLPRRKAFLTVKLFIMLYSEGSIDRRSAFNTATVIMWYLTWVCLISLGVITLVVNLAR